MCARKVALIGHSGAGKSSHLLHVGADRRLADMDSTFAGRPSPPLAEALAWLTESTEGQPVVVVSNHEEMLKAMRLAKSQGLYQERFARLWFVYLCKPKDQIARHLAMPTAGGRDREPAGRDYGLANYERFHALFQALADDTIDCADKTVAGVATEIRAIEESLERDAG
jgi:hypothetical protein